MKQAREESGLKKKSSRRGADLTAIECNEQKEARESKRLFWV